MGWRPGSYGPTRQSGEAGQRTITTHHGIDQYHINSPPTTTLPRPGSPRRNERVTMSLARLDDASRKSQQFSQYKWSCASAGRGRRRDVGRTIPTHKSEKKKNKPEQQQSRRPPLLPEAKSPGPGKRKGKRKGSFDFVCADTRRILSGIIGAA